MNETPNGMVREDKNNKLNFLSYFTIAGIRRYAEHMKHGEIKHGRANWQKGGYPKEEFLESATRHLFNLAAGDTDEDHCAAVIFNMFGYMNEEVNTPTKSNEGIINGVRFSDLDSNS